MSIRSRRWEKQEVKSSSAARSTTNLMATLTLNSALLQSGKLAAVMLLAASLVAVAQSQDQPAPAPSPADASAAQAAGPEASSQAPQAVAQGAAPLRVMVGKSLLINTTERLQASLGHRRHRGRRDRRYPDPDPGSRPVCGRGVVADLGRTGTFA